MKEGGWVRWREYVRVLFQLLLLFLRIRVQGHQLRVGIGKEVLGAEERGGCTKSGLKGRRLNGIG